MWKPKRNPVPIRHNVSCLIPVPVEAKTPPLGLLFTRNRLVNKPNAIPYPRSHLEPSPKCTFKPPYPRNPNPHDHSLSQNQS
uniref:Uncharacterized protein n=1 Tax=Cucumis melo TaxID=3656 RepID=A0A9I9EEX0_CUCME